MGRKMVEFPLDPPLAKMLLVGAELGCSSEVRKLAHPAPVACMRLAVVLTHLAALFGFESHAMGLSTLCSTCACAPQGQEAVALQVLTLSFTLSVQSVLFRPQDRAPGVEHIKPSRQPIRFCCLNACVPVSTTRC